MVSFKRYYQSTDSVQGTSTGGVNRSEEEREISFYFWNINRITNSPTGMRISEGKVFKKSDIFCHPVGHNFQGD